MTSVAWTLLVIGVIAVIIVIALSLVRYTAFLVSNSRAGLLAQAHDDRGGLARPLLAGLGTSVVSGIMALAAYPLAWLPRREREPGLLPVVLVHGLYHNRSAWVLFARWLARAGFTDLHTFQYNTFTGDFDTATDSLCQTLDRLLGPRPGARAILVGHSLGGLVCRAAAGDPRFAGRVAALITLGTPHHGSELARLGMGGMARGLIPGRTIAQHGIPATVAAVPDPDCPRLALISPVDDFVFPASCLRTGRPGWDERLVAPMSHVFMLYSREVTAQVTDFLKSAVRDAPRPPSRQGR
ncbi:MAG: alpha/beta fold hydrolase [Pseudodesulfovibrio sp.]|uniref:Acetyltransferase and hydrolase with the alpha/beta hydrolase fold-like protein n=1 Tax=Pseudodesulfovibrio aespoeensis (strain ATCC 700646 / DSM 10631 / Aspo-2) TaxID=643562 RepID=E6VZI2_PSEA9|nr:MULTISPECIES: alpha/beta fold hydrolase [Pseudodesulfovibrio]MBU4191939.1 alpha/beta fold hydrolase [Pseudomonadota bacterium]ADU61696.1 acetyltransferase and hydrolase with the alpha/beta hydrolase fold-like protein [Pseudodesulfovibrio aespoeensis Aspo-2]MBU4244265.1 alpha/beta fold hydrolase [Pseudomonadota bacterium]MBU4379442.1 alpha/beta fold hydrolase [Pseudomonadota bacterium]MBU4474896.1 alpha/beta fold hydrolase [Pseudomonadota bacterium]